MENVFVVLILISPFWKVNNLFFKDPRAFQPQKGHTKSSKTKEIITSKGMTRSDDDDDDRPK